MSCYFRQNGEASVTIPKFLESSTGVTFYDIKIKINQIEWMVERRYKDFDQLHEKLVEEMSIAKNLLPPKKLMGNKNPTFLEQRRQQLEKYLQELLIFFRIHLPKALAEFLDFNKYDIIYLLQDLAKLFNENGDALLSNNKEYTFSALEVYAISERLSLPCPPESIEQRGIFDFSHVLDFCTQLEVLIVTPTKENSSFDKHYNTIDVPIGRSNIIPKTLTFNLNAFRNLKMLQFHGISMENVIDIDVLQSSMEIIYIHNTTITHISQVLMCDSVHKYVAVPPAKYITIKEEDGDGNSTQNANSITKWPKLSQLDISGNLLTQIDTSIRTATNLRKLVLEQNRIKTLQNLADLTHLQVLSLSVNLIADINDWHLELGNLVTLKLAQNQIKHLSGLRKLLSLVNLDLSCNKIEDLNEVDNVACLPLLETLHLTGNPLAGSVDYRPRVFARFHERAPEIVLDRERGSQQELDTALALSALIKSKKRQQKKQ